VPGVTDSAVRFRHVDRVRFADLDAMRHLNNVAFLTFVESARVAWVTELLTGYSPEHRDEFGMITAEATITYRSPAYYDEEIHTWLRADHVGTKSLRMAFEMRAAPDDRLLADGSFVLVGFAYARNETVALPDELRDALLA
jgi:acyl-CoA thioester hydrolase